MSLNKISNLKPRFHYFAVICLSHGKCYKFCFSASDYKSFGNDSQGGTCHSGHPELMILCYNHSYLGQNKLPLLVFQERIMFYIDALGTQCGDPRRIYLHQRNPANCACVSDPQKLYLTTMCEAAKF